MVPPQLGRESLHQLGHSSSSHRRSNVGENWSFRRNCGYRLGPVDRSSPVQLGPHGKLPNENLWSDPYHVLVAEYRKASERLGLQSLGSCLYTLRRGGATHDIVTRRRSMLEVKQRSRWASDNSLKRYVKLARLQCEQSKMSPTLIEKGQDVLRKLPDLLGHSMSNHPMSRARQPSHGECRRKQRLAR